VFLKSIELFGFKSFADRSRIEFTDGVSALLGPNGCGKSNVVDGIKWVLGEQATRSLRAERMEDVIFNGTEDRKALNVAEVTLTLANDSGILPIDSAEISVRRRLFRSGDSEYYINGAPVRLREVRELFYDTGIGKSAYSIMEQGKIDQILSTKPEERRLIFEEAAGITKYKARGREAERKLERTEDNMRQVQSVLKEVGRSHESLRKQAEKTLEYRRLREKSFEVERDVTLLRLRTLVDERDKRQEQLERKEKRRDELRAQIDGINESLEENLDIVNSMEARLIDQQKRLYGVELEKNNRENQIRLHGERVTELDQKISDGVSRETRTKERIAGLEKQVAEVESEMTGHRERIAEVDKNIETFREHVEHAEHRIRENRAEIGGCNATISEEETRGIEYEGALRELTDDIVQKLDAALAESGYSRTERNKQESATAAAFDELARLLRSRGDQVTDSLASGDTNRGREAVEALFSELTERITATREAFQKYRDSIPSFLDEFVAPEGIITQKREIDSRIVQSRETIAANRASITRLQKDNEALSAKIGEYRKTLEDLRMNRVRMATQLTGMESTLGQHQRSIAEQKSLLAQHAEELARDRNRLVETKAKIDSLGSELEELAKQELALQSEQKELQQTISTRNEDLLKKERGLKDKMENLGKTQSELERLQIQVAETGAEIRNLYENFRERFSQELTDHEPRMLEIEQSVSDLRSELAALREKERGLGAVNLAAPEEFAEISERFEFLSSQLHDLEQAQEDLKRVTEEIQSESAALFARTYEQIKKNFHVMFRRLFGGGRAEMKLTDPEHILESGVEVYVQPPGKKLENIALLSGGERSLTAVGILFATYMVRPSPFCLLDEIDAALDESNVGRFTSMLMEFAESSQFIVITHNKKTVAAARTLLGVTMEEHGVSKVISIRIGGEPVHA
jgi:chromosome segregation protein